MNQSTNILTDLFEQARSLMNKNVSFTQIETVLMDAGHDAELIKSTIASLKKEKHSKDFKKGVTLLITGGLILLASFIITVSFFHTNIPLDYFMYISSIIGITFCFLGFKKIFH